MSRILVFFVSEDWYFQSHRWPIAKEAQAQGFQVHLIARRSAAASELEAAGITVHDFNIGRGAVDLQGHRGKLRALESILRDIQPDVLHNVAMKPVIYGSLAARRLGRTPRIVNALGGLGFLFSSRSFKARLLRVPAVLALRSALNAAPGKLVLQNDADRQVVQRYRLVSDSRIAMVRGSGVDTNVFAPTARDRQIPVVAFAGRFLKDKGVHEFIAAVARLRAAGSHARFVMIGGPDSENPSSIRTAELLQRTDQFDIERWGWRDDMSDALADVDVMVLPSYREGMPKSLIEAASAGIPIVTTDAPGCRDVVDDGVNGYLVPTRSVDALVDAITKLVSDPELRRKFGEAGRTKALSEFSVRDVVHSTLALYEDTEVERGA